jgi:hypothetical protein
MLSIARFEAVLSDHDSLPNAQPVSTCMPLNNSKYEHCGKVLRDASDECITKTATCSCRGSDIPYMVIIRVTVR